MKSNNILFQTLAITAILSGLIFTACKKDSKADTTTTTGTQKLSVYLTDDPAIYDSVLIDIKYVEVKLDTNEGHKNDDHFGDGAHEAAVDRFFNDRRDVVVSHNFIFMKPVIGMTLEFRFGENHRSFAQRNRAQRSEFAGDLRAFGGKGPLGALLDQKDLAVGFQIIKCHLVFKKSAV